MGQLSVDSVNQDSNVVGPLHAGEKTPNTAIRKVTRYRKGSRCCTRLTQEEEQTTLDDSRRVPQHHCQIIARDVRVVEADAEQACVDTSPHFHVKDSEFQGNINASKLTARQVRTGVSSQRPEPPWSLSDLEAPRASPSDLFSGPWASSHAWRRSTRISLMPSALSFVSFAL